MKVKNMTSNSGSTIANQFIIEDYKDGIRSCVFQSYDSTIVADYYDEGDNLREIYLDADTWNYSRTTSKYRNIFLGETTAETKAKIKSGEYQLTNLN